MINDQRTAYKNLLCFDEAFVSELSLNSFGANVGALVWPVSNGACDGALVSPFRVGEAVTGDLVGYFTGDNVVYGV